MKIENNKIKFQDETKWYEKDLKITKDIVGVDFNNLLIFKGVLDLSESTLKYLDLKKLRWVEDIINPFNIRIRGIELIRSKYLKGNTPKLEYYKDWNKPLIYLGGKIDGGLNEDGSAIESLLDLRAEQERELLKRNNIRVYNPGGVITYPDEAVLTFPYFPGQLDIKMIDEADYLFYDLRQVSEGTRAEFGYSIGKGYHKTKKIFVLVNDVVTNCLTLALLENCIIVKSMSEILDLIEYSELLKKVRRVNFKWWKVDEDYLQLNSEYKISWKSKWEKIKKHDSIQKYIDAIDFKYLINLNINNLLLAINCEILEYLESKNEDEKADIFIFSILLYKTLLQQGWKVEIDNYDNKRINLIPITFENLLKHLPRLINWSSSVGDKIIDKLQYNNERQDHK